METLFKNQETLALFLIFFIPGFISLKVYDLLIPGERRDFSKSLFDAVAYSSLNFAALWWLIALVRNAPGLQLYAGMFVLLIAAPALWPVVRVQIRRWACDFSVIFDGVMTVIDCVALVTEPRP